MKILPSGFGVLPARLAPGPAFADRALAVVLLLSLTAKLILVHQGAVQDRSILDMEFGFGPVITSLYERGTLEACGVAAALDFCGVAARMPLLPWLYVVAAKLIGLEQVHLAIARSVLATPLLWLSARYLSRAPVIRPAHRFFLLALVALLFLGPQYLKHAISIQYEESLLMDVLPVYCFLLGGLVLRRRAGAPNRADRTVQVTLVLLASSLYLLKSSLLLFALVAIAAPLGLVTTPAWARVIGLAPFLLALLWWGQVNAGYHGEIHLGSSYNGENFYRGQNDYSHRIYPELNLDRLIDAREAILNSGERVILPEWARHFPPFRNEWEWHDYFKRLGQDWIRENPGKALGLTLRKAWVLFVEPRKVPFRQAALPALEPRDYGRGALVAGVGWMVLLRCLFFGGVALAARECLTTRRLDRLPAWYLLLILAYAAPYLVGFAYQRHVVPMLMIAAILFPPLVLRGDATAAADRRATPGTGG